jgi:cardiolipin synthase
MKLKKYFFFLFVTFFSFFSRAETFVSSGNIVTSLQTGRELNVKRLELIQNAKYFIYLKTFIINRDLSEAPVFNALCEKSRAGVDVRMLVDDIGRRAGGNPIRMKTGIFSIEWFKSCGIRFERYAKISWGLVDFALYNQHDKILVSENEGIMGGTNYSRDYSSHGKFSKRWYDFDISLKGPAICGLQNIFNKSWEYAYKEEFKGLKGLSTSGRRQKIEERFSPFTLDRVCHFPEEVGRSAVSLLFNNPLFSVARPFQDYIINSLDKVIEGNGDKTVNLYSPYFVPSKIIVSKLIRAAKSGVKVRIITNSETSIDPDVYPAYVAMLMRVKPLLLNGVEIYLWNPSSHSESGLEKDNVFHKKGGCFGTDNCFVGSHNLDIRGDKFSSELMAVIDDQELVEERRENFEDDLYYTFALNDDSRREMLKHAKISKKIIAKIGGWAM